jgi:hypothetical protein
VFQRPQEQREVARRRFQERRNVNVISAEANAVFAQLRASLLIESLYFVGDADAVEYAERFHELECNTARHAGDVFGFGKRVQRSQ